MSQARLGEKHRPGLGRYTPYPEYKDSGVEWLGEVPAHWDVKRLKHVAALNPEALPEETDPTLELSYVDIGRVDSLGRIIEHENLSFAAAPTRARRLVRDGDVIVSTVRTYLRAIAAIKDPKPGMVVSTGFAVLRPDDDLWTNYAAYALRAPYFVERVVANSKGVSFPAINESEMATYELAIPPAPEQRAIAAFLDRETARIDELIAKKERLIELLQEKRSAVITRAVTKGLDPTVPMKDSGVEWLGEIQADWTTMRLRDLADSLQTGPFGTQLHHSEYVAREIPIVNPGNLVDGRIVPDWDRTVDGATASRLSRHVLAEGDIVLARRGEMGRCGLVTSNEAGWLCGTGCLRLRLVTASALPSYVLLVLGTERLRDWLALESVGATMENLNTGIIGRIPIALPSVSEQQKIATLLDQETAKIDSLTMRARSAIDRLKELRAALISAAVTGKIDVREEVA